MTAKFIILFTYQALLLVFLIQDVTSIPREKVVETTQAEPAVIIVYSTSEKEIRVKNGSNVYSIPTPGDMRLATYDPKHAELYLAFHFRPESPEQSAGLDAGTIYRVTLSDNKAENSVSVFANRSSSKGDFRFLKCLAYDDVDEKLYFCGQRGVGSCSRDSRNCTILHDFFRKGALCRFALNPGKGTLYLEEPHALKFPSIHKGSKDGTGEFVKIIEQARSLTVDQDSGFLFYFTVRDSTNSTKVSPAGTSDPSLLVYDIMRCDLEGKNREPVRTLGHERASYLQVADDRIYWAERRERKDVIFSCNKFNGKDLKEHQLDGLGSDTTFIVVNFLVVAQNKSSLRP